MKSLVKLLFCFGLLAAAAPLSVYAQREKFSPEDLAFIEKTWPDAKKTNTGIRYVIQQPGTGEQVKAGDKVAVLYVGKLLNGTVFDQATEKDKAFTFRVGREQVIQGWDQVFVLMKVGEKRTIIIPGELAYGTRGQPPKIPRNASLVFEVEVLEIKKD
ncbi:MAG: FKBP-type peptidyl-prolyl cis-trans isomerase [Verrucomicrobia bacterium]|nr:FKBP-type peptidyl-prolyl cis-trans isomerase [Verrucomicrobiota bacterium]